MKTVPEKKFYIERERIVFINGNIAFAVSLFKKQIKIHLSFYWRNPM